MFQHIIGFYTTSSSISIATSASLHSSLTNILVISCRLMFQHIIGFYTTSSSISIATSASLHSSLTNILVISCRLMFQHIIGFYTTSSSISIATSASLHSSLNLGINTVAQSKLNVSHSARISKCTNTFACFCISYEHSKEVQCLLIGVMSLTIAAVDIAFAHRHLQWY